MASLAEFTSVLGMDNAAHLLRRATFGPDINQIQSFSTLTPAQAVASLFVDETIPEPPIDTATSDSWVNPPTQHKAVEGANSEQDTLHAYFKAWYVDVILNSGMSVKERITWFFHSHLPARWTEIRSSEAIYYQNCIMRYYAFGSFKDLFKKICIDNAMLRYLDGYTNHKDTPNENFAREMFELYSIGKGPQIAEGNYTNYTEDDIKAATKILTGWLFDDDFSNIDPDCGWPIGRMSADVTDIQAQSHDGTTKTFSSIFAGTSISPSAFDGGYPTVEAAHQELDELIEMIFNNQETARFITRKLYRHFVYHFISEEVEADIIGPLSQVLYNNNYTIAEALKVLFVSQHFYDADDGVTANNNIGALIKSPMELAVGLLRFFNIQLPDRNTDTTQFYTDMLDGVIANFDEQGLHFFEPFEVAGYPAYHQMPAYGRNWIMSTELAYRYQIGERFMHKIGTPTYNFRIDVLDWVENSGYIADPGDAEELVTTLTARLLPVAITTERYEYFLNTVFLDTFTPTTWQFEWNSYTGGGSADVVRERIEILVSALIQTPEFQLN